MKFLKFTFTSLFILFVAAAYAQSCGNDTILYTRAKASGNASYTLSDASSFLAYAQYYDAPQDITVKGLCFYGHVVGNPANPVAVTGLLYDVDPTDSLPFDPPMASGTAYIINNDANAPLNDQRHCITFNQPVTMYNAYVVAIETPGNPAIKIWGNNFGDGDNEQLSLAKYNWPWIKMINFASDNDFYIEPIVEYTLIPSMSFSEDTVCAPGNLHVSGAAPDISFNRMYCKSAFNGNPMGGFQFGIGSDVLSETIDTFYNVQQTGPVVVTFTEFISGWTNDCVRTISDTAYFINDPVADYGTVGFGQDVGFYAHSQFATQYFWDFGDGTTATTTVDTIHHTFSGAGPFNVCLAVSNKCGTDTICAQFNTPFVGLDEVVQADFVLYPNPAKGEFYINSSNANQPTTIQIFDLSGRVISGETVTAMPASIDVESLTPGVYFARMQSGNASVTKKLVVTN